MRTKSLAEHVSKQERIDRLEQFSADVLDDIIIEEQNIDPHDCEHSPNYLLPIRIETDTIGNTQRIINRCMCCYAEIPDEHEPSYYTYMDTSRGN